MRAALLLLAAWLALPAGAVRAQEPVELQVLVHPPWFEGFSYLEATAQAFEAAHPGVRVRLLSSGSAAGEADKLKFMLAGGLPVDVTWIDVTEFAAFLDQEVLLDLQPFFDADPDWRPEDYFPQVLDAMRDRRGHLYGLCSTFTPYVMYVNLSLLEEAGVPRPPDDWTWDDLERLCRRLTRDEDGDGRPEVYGISITQWLQALAPWIWQNGGRFLDEEGRCALDEPPAVEAIAFLQRLIHEEKVASNDATFENQMSTGLFMAGRTAFYGPVGYWETYRFKEIRSFRWDVMPLPRHRQAATAVAMRFYVVPRATRHPRLAYEFVRALAGDTMQRGLARIGNGVPGLRRAAWSPDFLKPDVPPERERVFLDVLDHARFLPLSADWREVEKVTKAVLEEAVLLGRMPAAEACALAARRADEVLARSAELRRRPRLGAGPFRAAWTGGVAVVALLVAGLLLSGRRRPRPERREERAAWLFLAPWALGFAALLLGPALVAAVLSLAEWSPLRSLDSARWLGLDQYRRLLADPTFRDSLRVTGLYALAAVPLQLAVALGLALLVQGRFRGGGVFRTVFYLPTILSPVVLGAIWRWILAAEGGLLNRGLALLGLRGPDWLGAPAWVLPSFVLMGLWTAGAQMLVFLAGLQGLDPVLYEAARVDGAGRWARFRHVTLPGLGPVLLLNLVFGLLNAFQLFAQPYVMTRGGPGNASRFLVLYLYEQGFQFLHMGYASALAWVLFAVVMALTLALLATSRRWVHYAGTAR